ncbi:MAG: amidinotransferase [Deltaproteobacteria bacterium]|nr:amidinotransferase [Deltaproteobacteria bacterium]
MRLLMCPPLYYGTGQEDPAAGGSRRGNRQVAQEQWRALYRLLADDLNMEITLLEPRAALPDMVFTADAGLVWGDKFIASNLRDEARRAETRAFENWFQVRGYEIFHLPAENLFEGESDLLLCGDRFVASCRIPSADAVSHRKVAEILGRDVLPLKLAGSWLHHLDTCLCPLGQGQALYYPSAFDSEAAKILKDRIGTLVAVPEDEARRFACNAIVVEKSVVMNDGCPKTREQLHSLGFSVFETPLSEFAKAGGSAKCLVLKVPHREER